MVKDEIDLVKMRTGRPVLRHFAEPELAPMGSVAMDDESARPLLPDDVLRELRDFSRRLGSKGEAVLQTSTLVRRAHLATFISFCQILGAVKITFTDSSTVVRPNGRLGAHVPEMLSIFLERSFTILEGWSSSHIISEDRLSALEFLHQMELRRIELERRAGRTAEPLAERPVAFVVFRAKNDRGEDCYLFEMNKDWRRLNFIGGKQEPSDGGDYMETAIREVSEELGLARNRVALTRLNAHPLIGYSLSGNVGSLARYPCVLYGARVAGDWDIRKMQDRWLTEPTIRKAAALVDGPLMVNPVYLSFLLDGNPPRLSILPLSTDREVRSTPLKDLVFGGETTAGRWLRVARENKDLVVAVLTITAAIIGLVLAL